MLFYNSSIGQGSVVCRWHKLERRPSFALERSVLAELR